MNENDELNLFVIYTAKPGMREAFLNDVKSSGILQLILDEKGCRRYEYFASVQNPDTLLLAETWENAELQKIHMTQPHMTELKMIKERYIESTEIGRMIKN